MKFYFVLSLLILGACSRSGSQPPKLAPETPVAKKQIKDDLITELKKNDIFDSVQTSTLDKTYQIVKSTEGDEYFIQKGVVVSSSRAPRKNEKNLIYWRYYFKGKKCVEGKIDETGSMGHNLPMLRFACDSEGTGVIYDPNSEKVTRVFYYEAR